MKRRSVVLASTVLMLPAAGVGLAADAGGSTRIEQVIVTAQRRTENIQKSSLSIAAIGGKALARQGITQAQDLNGIVPGVQLGLAGNTAQPYVRGVGNADNTGFAVSGIAFNVDGVYIAQPVSYGASLYDVNRVEILRGPQGTLYGRNASGGAINVITNAPGNTMSGTVGAEFGSYGLYRFNGAATLPIIPGVLSVRGAFQESRRSGYDRDGSDDESLDQGRLRVKYTPDTALSVLLNFDAEHQGGHGPGFAVDIGPTYNVPAPFDGPQGSSSIGYLNALNPKSPQRQDQTDLGTSAQIDYKVGDFTFTALPAFRDVRVGLTNLNGFVYGVNLNSYDESTGEARVAYDNGPVKFVGGYYAFYERQTLNFFVDNFPIELAVRVPSFTTTAAAEFGQTTVSVADGLRLIGGFRFSREHESLQPSVNTYFPPISFQYSYSGDVTSHSVDYKGGVEYDLTPRNMLFANTSSGFKAGGIFPSPVGPFGGNTFKPERLRADTIGVRNQFLDQALQVNLEGFYWQYTNKQETFLADNGIGLLDNVTHNAGAATIDGFDVDTIWRFTPEDSVHVAAEYLNANYDSFSYLTPAPSVGCPATPAGNQFVVDCDGKQVERSPRWSGKVSYTHTFDLNRIGQLDFTGDLGFATTRYLAIYYTGPVLAPGYVKGDLTLTYTRPDAPWTVTGYVRNVGSAVIPTSAYASLKPDLYYLSLEAPRTYGVQLQYRF